MHLTHWGRVTHICVGNLTTTGSDNGLSPDRRQAIIWTNAGILSIGPLGINFSEISMEIQTFSFRKMRLKSSSAKWRPSCLGLNVLTQCCVSTGQVCVALPYLVPRSDYRSISWLVFYYWNIGSKPRDWLHGTEVGLASWHRVLSHQPRGNMPELNLTLSMPARFRPRDRDYMISQFPPFRNFPIFFRNFKTWLTF